MDIEKPPINDTSDGGISNPLYTANQEQLAYPPVQQQQGYPQAQQQLYPPTEQQQGYPPAEQQQGYPPYPPQNTYPPQPIIQTTGTEEPPPYDAGYEGNKQGDVEANLDGNSDVYGIISFDEKSVRLAFIRKVFGILALQMAVTVAVTAWFLFDESMKERVQDSLALYLSAYIVFVIILFVLTCCKGPARKYPVNLILLGVLTLSVSYMVAAISSFHDTKIVITAFGMTTVCTIAIIAFASQTKYDLTKCNSVLFCLGICFLLFGITAGALVPSGHMRILNVVYASLGALLFMAYLAFDIQMIMGGRKYELSPEDYVFGALMIYLDIINILLFILELLGKK